MTTAERLLAETPAVKVKGLTEAPGMHGRSDDENRRIATVGLEVRKVASELGKGEIARQVYKLLADGLPTVAEFDYEVSTAVWNNAVDAFVKALKEELEQMAGYAE